MHTLQTTTALATLTDAAGVDSGPAAAAAAAAA